MKKFKNAAFMLTSVVPLIVTPAGVTRTLANSITAVKAPVTSTQMTIVLSPMEAESLFKSSFDADSVFSKQDSHHQVKETYWIPTSADVAQAEASLTVYVKTSTHPFMGPTPNDLSYYFRQYAGVMRGSKKIILISGFPVDHKRGIAGYNHIITVSDGGFAFFHAAYNPKTRKIQNFKFNDVG